MKPHSDYFDAVTKCLMSFQYMEEVLKMILIRLESLTYFCLKPYTPYNLKPKYIAIENSAMGRLIDMLSTYTDDKSLITELRKIKKKRDQLAHRSLLMTVDDVQDKINMYLKISELEELTKTSNELLNKLVEKWQGLDGLLNKIAAEQRATPDQRGAHASR
jgi:hypothetical protein